MKASTLFSGIGAPEAAMPSWDWLWSAEVSAFPSAVLAARHPQTVNLGDVTADDFIARARATGLPDVVVFGSPCQSYSVAGKRLGLDDPRGNLALHALRIIGELRPRWFVFENVPGLFSSWSSGPAGDAGWSEGPEDDDHFGRTFIESSDFAAFLHAVADIGYQCAWTVLDAQYFGVAQRRERVFAVGYLGDWRGPAAVLLEPQSLCGDSPPRRETRQDVAGTLARRASAGGGLGTDFDCQGGFDYAPLTVPPITHSGRGVSRAGESRDERILPARFASATDGPEGTLDSNHGNIRPEQAWTNRLVVPEVANVLTHRMHKGISTTCDEGQTLVAHALRSSGFDANEDGTGRGTPLVPVGVLPSVESENARQDPDCWDDRSGPIDTDGSTQAIAFTQNQRDEVRTLAVAGERASDPGMKQQTYVHQSGVRRLMPVECERLQGFPDDYTLVSYRGKPAKAGPRYQAIGNSMAVPVVRWILQRVEFVDALLQRGVTR